MVVELPWHQNQPLKLIRKRAEIVGTGLLVSRPIRFRISQSNRRPQIQATSITGNRSSPGEPQAHHNSSDLRRLL